MADKKEKLFSDFSPASTEQWMEKVTEFIMGPQLRSSHRAPLRICSGCRRVSW